MATSLLNQLREPLAIVGIGCRFPGNAASPDAFWELLRDRRDAVVEIPADRWDWRRFYDPDRSAPGKMYVQHGAFLQDTDITKMDAEFFGISPREAGPLDPQQRLLLEVTWEAFEDAAIDPGSLREHLIGVFVGGSH